MVPRKFSRLSIYFLKYESYFILINDIIRRVFHDKKLTVYTNYRRVRVLKIGLEYIPLVELHANLNKAFKRIILLMHTYH